MTLASGLPHDEVDDRSDGTGEEGQDRPKDPIHAALLRVGIDPVADSDIDNEPK
jgi:hypothetical protein